jgi:FdhE protein
MTSAPTWDAAMIETSVATLTAIRPAYAAILGFYGPVFIAQAKSAQHTCPPAIQVDEALAAMKSEEGFAMIEPTAFEVDTVAAEPLLTQIARIAAASGEQLSRAGQALTRVGNQGLAVADLFTVVLKQRDRLNDIAGQLNVAPDMLSMLLYLAIKPSIEAGARQLAERLTGDPKNRPNCPLCGSAPLLGELDGEGGQWVHCHLCWHRWPIDRMGCPSCHNRNTDSLRYLFSDAEPEYRLKLCDSCKRYLKVVDTRKMARGFYPPLEQVVSLHLDMTAAEKGYTHPMGTAHPTS